MLEGFRETERNQGYQIFGIFGSSRFFLFSKPESGREIHPGGQQADMRLSHHICRHSWKQDGISGRQISGMESMRALLPLVLERGKIARAIT